MNGAAELQPNKDFYKCRYCSRKFSSKSEVQNHRKTHGPRLHKCTLCTYSTTKKVVFTNHIRTHTKEKPFKCQHPNCNFASSHACSIIVHQLVHTKNAGSLPKYRCQVPDCSYETNRRGDFHFHSITHSDAKPFACDFCPFRGKTKKSVQLHGRLHTSEKRFTCPHSNCHYTSHFKGNLGQHLKTHGDEKELPCSFLGCTYTARLKSHLIRHQRKHTGEKPYKCNFCPKSFIQRSVLVVHIRGHTGEAPYPCQICSFRGKVSGELTRHVKVHHSSTSKKTRKVNRTKLSHIKGQSSSIKCKAVNCHFLTSTDSELAIHLNSVHHLPRVVL